MAECVEAFIVIAELVRQDIVTRRELHAVADDRNRVVGTPVEELVARRRDADGQMVALAREVQEVVVKAVLVVARRTVAVVVDGEQALLAVVRVEVERHMDRARVLARRQDGLGVGTREVREQPDGALKVGARQVVALLEEGRLALDDALMDLRVVLNRDAVKATDRHGVLDDTVLDLLYRKVGVRGDVALVAEVARQRVGAILQVLERHELALLVGEQALERFLAVDVLARDLEVIDLYLQRIRQVEARALLLLNLDVGIAKRDVLLIKFFFWSANPAATYQRPASVLPIPSPYSAGQRLRQRPASPCSCPCSWQHVCHVSYVSSKTTPLFFTSSSFNFYCRVCLVFIVLPEVLRSRVCLYSSNTLRSLNANSCLIRKIISKYHQEYINRQIYSFCPTIKNRQSPDGDCLLKRRVSL